MISLPRPRTRCRLTVLGVLVVGAVSACSDAAPATSTSGDTVSHPDAADGGATAAYTPFLQANLQNQLVRVAGFHAIQALRKSADFKADSFGETCAKWNVAGTTPTDLSKIASLYVESAELQTKVKARKDAHTHNKDAALGLAIDASVCGAIEAGAKAGGVARNAVGSIDWHAQVVDKGLQHFFYLSLYNYLVAGTRKGYDEGVGYFGRALDGSTDAKGLAATVKARDENCGTAHAAGIWEQLKKGRAELEKTLAAAGKTGNEDAVPPSAAALEIAADVDRRLLHVFALSMGRELLELQQGTDPAIKLIEARMFWRMLRPHVAAHDQAKGTQLVADLDARLGQDDPAKGQPAFGLTALQTVFGLDVAQLCTK
ncbi:MAG: hypothetical protein EXR79_07990 [Myxococcales bacterium]|nr:hypothetical protein [Myxococcales bacterium]